jgi:hypothetical protein
MKPEVFDNVLRPDQFSQIYDMMFSDKFPWFYAPGKSHRSENETNKQIFQFVHHFYADYSWRSPLSEMVDPIIKILKPLSIIRIKANLTTITPEKIKYTYHRDTGYNIVNSKTAIFYLNTNNGLTIFSNGDEIESVANRLVVFDSNILHTGTSCTDESTRVVINFNYFVPAV